MTTYKDIAEYIVKFNETKVSKLTLWYKYGKYDPIHAGWYQIKFATGPLKDVPDQVRYWTGYMWNPPMKIMDPNSRVYDGPVLNGYVLNREYGDVQNYDWWRGIKDSPIVELEYIADLIANQLIKECRRIRDTEGMHVDAKIFAKKVMKLCRLLRL